MSAADALPYSGDGAHDRRVRARLAELAAERGLPLPEVLDQLNAALADGRPPVEQPPAADRAAAAPAVPRARVIARRPADEEWGVTTYEADAGPPAARAQPCGGLEPCPWRRDAPPGQFPAEAYRHSAATSRPGADRRFGCHSSRPGQPQMCAGWLLRGAWHHPGVQRMLADGTLARPVLPAGVELYDSYAEMAIANGVAPDDPALIGPAPTAAADIVPFPGDQPKEEAR